MDSKEIKNLMEAYGEMYAPQEEISEAVKGADPEMRKVASAERRGGDKQLSPSKGKGYADQQKQQIAYMDKVTKKNKNVVGLVTKEELDVFDTVLEYLQTEGYENPEQMMTQLSSEEIDAILEATYSAKAARAGKDIGKPGKAFAKIAASAAKRYGSKERGEKVAGAVLAKLRKEEIELLEDAMQLDELSNRKLRAYVKKSEKSHQDLNKKWDQGTASYKDKYKSINRERGQERALDILDKRSGK